MASQRPGESERIAQAVPSRGRLGHTDAVGRVGHTDGAASTPGPRRRRRRAWPKRLMAAILVAWFTWFAYVRITRPAATSAAAPGAPEVDPAQRAAGDEIASLLRGLPPVPLPTTAPSTGWVGGGGVLLSALFGLWDPAGRDEVAKTVAYLDRPEVNSALDRLVVLLDGQPDSTLTRCSIATTRATPAATAGWC